MKTPFHAGQARRGAFSLVEVVLAMGIMSVCLVTLLGLMPVGLNTLRDAMDATTKAQITQQMQGKAITTPFTQLSTLTNATYYFDQDGFEQLSTSTPQPPNASTRFKVTFTQKSSVYPGVADQSMDASIVTLIMNIAFSNRGPAATAATVAISVPNQSGSASASSQ